MTVDRGLSPTALNRTKSGASLASSAAGLSGLSGSVAVSHSVSDKLKEIGGWQRTLKDFMQKSGKLNDLVTHFTQKFVQVGESKNFTLTVLTDMAWTVLILTWEAILDGDLPITTISESFRERYENLNVQFQLCRKAWLSEITELRDRRREKRFGAWFTEACTVDAHEVFRFLPEEALLPEEAKEYFHGAVEETVKVAFARTSETQLAEQLMVTERRLEASLTEIDELRLRIQDLQIQVSDKKTEKAKEDAYLKEELKKAHHSQMSLQKQVESMSDRLLAGMDKKSASRRSSSGLSMAPEDVSADEVRHLRDNIRKLNTQLSMAHRQASTLDLTALEESSECASSRSPLSVRRHGSMDMRSLPSDRSDRPVKTLTVESEGGRADTKRSALLARRRQATQDDDTEADLSSLSLTLKVKPDEEVRRPSRSALASASRPGTATRGRRASFLDSGVEREASPTSQADPLSARTQDGTGNATPGASVKIRDLRARESRWQAERQELTKKLEDLEAEKNDLAAAVQAQQWMELSRSLSKAGSRSSDDNEPQPQVVTAVSEESMEVRMLENKILESSKKLGESAELEAQNLLLKEKLVAQTMVKKTLEVAMEALQEKFVEIRKLLVEKGVDGTVVDNVFQLLGVKPGTGHVKVLDRLYYDAVKKKTAEGAVDPKTLSKRRPSMTDMFRAAGQGAMLRARFGHTGGEAETPKAVPSGNILASQAVSNGGIDAQHQAPKQTSSPKLVPKASEADSQGSPSPPLSGRTGKHATAKKKAGKGAAKSRPAPARQQQQQHQTKQEQQEQHQPQQEHRQEQQQGVRSLSAASAVPSQAAAGRGAAAAAAVALAAGGGGGGGAGGGGEEGGPGGEAGSFGRRSRPLSGDRRSRPLSGERNGSMPVSDTMSRESSLRTGFAGLRPLQLSGDADDGSLLDTCTVQSQPQLPVQQLRPVSPTASGTSPRTPSRGSAPQLELLRHSAGQEPMNSSRYKNRLEAPTVSTPTARQASKQQQQAMAGASSASLQPMRPTSPSGGSIALSAFEPNVEPGQDFFPSFMEEEELRRIIAEIRTYGPANVQSRLRRATVGRRALTSKEADATVAHLELLVRLCGNSAIMRNASKMQDLALPGGDGVSSTTSEALSRPQSAPAQGGGAASKLPTETGEQQTQTEPPREDQGEQARQPRKLREQEEEERAKRWQQEEAERQQRRQQEDEKEMSERQQRRQQEEQERQQRQEQENREQQQRLQEEERDRSQRLKEQEERQRQQQLQQEERERQQSRQQELLQEQLQQLQQQLQEQLDQQKQLKAQLQQQKQQKQPQPQQTQPQPQQQQPQQQQPQPQQQQQQKQQLEQQQQQLEQQKKQLEQFELQKKQLEEQLQKPPHKDVQTQTQEGEVPANERQQLPLSLEQKTKHTPKQSPDSDAPVAVAAAVPPSPPPAPKEVPPVAASPPLHLPVHGRQEAAALKELQLQQQELQQENKVLQQQVAELQEQLQLLRQQLGQPGQVLRSRSSTRQLQLPDGQDFSPRSSPARQSVGSPSARQALTAARAGRSETHRRGGDHSRPSMRSRASSIGSDAGGFLAAAAAAAADSRSVGHWNLVTASAPHFLVEGTPAGASESGRAFGLDGDSDPSGWGSRPPSAHMLRRGNSSGSGSRPVSGQLWRGGSSRPPSALRKAESAGDGPFGLEVDKESGTVAPPPAVPAIAAAPCRHSSLPAVTPAAEPLGAAWTRQLIDGSTLGPAWEVRPGVSAAELDGCGRRPTSHSASCPTLPPATQPSQAQDASARTGKAVASAIGSTSAPTALPPARPNTACGGVRTQSPPQQETQQEEEGQQAQRRQQQQQQAQRVLFTTESEPALAISVVKSSGGQAQAAATGKKGGGGKVRNVRAPATIKIDPALPARPATAPDRLALALGSVAALAGCAEDAGGKGGDGSPTRLQRRLVVDDAGVPHLRARTGSPPRAEEPVVHPLRLIDDWLQEPLHGQGIERVGQKNSPRASSPPTSPRTAPKAAAADRAEKKQLDKKALAQMSAALQFRQKVLKPGTKSVPAKNLGADSKAQVTVQREYVSVSSQVKLRQR